MRSIDRFEEPEILIRKKKEWTEKFIRSGKKRPDNSKYGHPQIKTALYSMSHNKCFYCETKLKETPSETDHFIEVIEDKSLAFKWTNLYLACNSCNKKIPNRSINVKDIIDPCNTSSEEIIDNLDFEDEQITSKNGSTLGLRTIQKFRLSSKHLDYLRAKQLQLFHKILIGILEQQKKDNRNEFRDEERDLLMSFGGNDQPYSLMFKKLIGNYEN